MVDLCRALSSLGIEILSSGGTARLLGENGDSRDPASPTTPASRRCSTAGSRRCTRGSTAASWPCAPTHSTWPTCEKHGHRADRPGGGQPLPVREDRGDRGHRRGRRGGDDRHRRPDDGPRRGQELRRTSASWSIPPTTPASPRRSQESGALVRRDPAARWRSRRSGTPAPTTARSRPTSAASAPTASRRGDRRSWPRRCSIELVKVQDLRYGENPHQKAAFYRDPLNTATVDLPRRSSSRARSCPSTTSSTSTRRWAWPRSSTDGACAIIKHGNPCGAALGADPRTALRARPGLRPD